MCLALGSLGKGFRDLGFRFPGFVDSAPGGPCYS